MKRVLEPEKNDVVIDLVEHLGDAQRADDNPVELDPEKLNTLEEVEDQLNENKTAQTIQDAKVNGEIQAEAIRQIGTLVQNNPKEATSVIRNWVDEEKAA